MAWVSESDLDRKELRAAILDLVRIATLWESGALARGNPETRRGREAAAANRRCAVEHQSGAKSVPVARLGRHVVRRVDLRLARAHQQVAEILRGLDGPVDDGRRSACSVAPSSLAA